MKEQIALIEGLCEKTSNYAKKNFELYELKIIDKTADVASTWLSRIIVALVVLLFFFILNIGVALWLGEILGGNYYGFFGVAAFYAFISVLLYFFHAKWIKEPLQDSIVEEALK